MALYDPLQAIANDARFFCDLQAPATSPHLDEEEDEASLEEAPRIGGRRPREANR